MKNISRINFIGLNKKESNLWKLLKEKLISPSGIPDLDIIIAGRSSKKTPDTTTSDRLLRNIYDNTTTIRFGVESSENLFQEPSESRKSVIPILLMWTTIDDTFYYNFIKNKDKEPTKRKVIFGQTLTIQSSSILSGRE